MTDLQNIVNQRFTTIIEKGNEFLDCRYPIMGGAMTWLSENNLVSAISNAGAFGIIACGSMNPSELKYEIKQTQIKTKYNFGVNLILMHPELQKLLDICIETDVKYVVFAGGFPKKSQILYLKNNNIKSIGFATSLRIAKKLEANGIDALIIEGSEAGGHVGPVSTGVLVQEILPFINEIPIFIAGGIGRGESFLNYLQQGASGCQIGTRFVCANESIAHENFKNIFIRSESRNAQISSQLDDRLPVIPVRAITNKATKLFWEEQKKVLLELENKRVSLREAQLKIEKFWAGSLKKAVIDGDVDNGSLMAGQSVSMVKKIQSVEEIINEIVFQAKEGLLKQFKNK
tara:strand:+ start:25719 stop:26753 length:1035 start_codon:yes stop_codon:yes gene_type:complete